MGRCGLSGLFSTSVGFAGGAGWKLLATMLLRLPAVSFRRHFGVLALTMEVSLRDAFCSRSLSLLCMIFTVVDVCLGSMPQDPNGENDEDMAERQAGNANARELKAMLIEVEEAQLASFTGHEADPEVAGLVAAKRVERDALRKGPAAHAATAGALQNSVDARLWAVMKYDKLVEDLVQLREQMALKEAATELEANIRKDRAGTISLERPCTCGWRSGQQF